MSYWRKYRKVSKALARLVETSSSESDGERDEDGMSSTANSLALSSENDEMAGGDSLVMTDECDIDSAFLQMSFSEHESDYELEHSADLCKDLRTWGSNSGLSREKFNELLSIMRSHNIDVPKDMRTVLKTPKHVTDVSKCGGKYLYFGLKKGIKAFLKHQQFEEELIQLKINIDGLPLFKSTNADLWPILCCINNCNPFVVAVYFGQGKPNSVSAYLEDFLNEYTVLRDNGLLFNNTTYKVIIKAFICDSPARAFIKCVKQCGGYNGCERCDIHGEWHSGRVVYHSNGDSVLRTNEDFRLLKYIEHQVGTEPSPLIAANIPCVSIFVLDYMHLVCLGVVRRLLRYVKSEGPKCCLLSYKQQCEVSDKLISFRDYVPSEFARRPRSLVELDRWKATEFRQFMLYTGPVALRGIMSSDLYEHFLCLFIAMTILLYDDSRKREAYVGYARNLLNVFVTNARKLYGETFTVYNVHNLLHLADDVDIHRCSLDFISAFPFENHLRILKGSVRSNNKPVVQIAKRLQEKSINELSSKTKRRFSLHRRDRVFFMDNDEFAVLKEDMKDDNIFKCVFIKQSMMQPFFDKPCDSRLFNICFIPKSLDSYNEPLHFVRRAQLMQKAICLPYKNGCVLFPLVANHEK